RSDRALLQRLARATRRHTSRCGARATPGRTGAGAYTHRIGARATVAGMLVAAVCDAHIHQPGEWSLSIEGGSRDAVSGNVALLLWRVAERCGARPAVVERDQSVGYAALVKRTAAIAAALRAAGVAPEDPVASLLERGGHAVVSYLGITPDDRVASLLPFSFVYGMSQLLCAVAAAATLVVERSPLPQQILETVRARKVTVLAAVPPLWLRLLNVPAFREAPLPDLRVMTNAGGRPGYRARRVLRRPGAERCRWLSLLREPQGPDHQDDGVPRRSRRGRQRAVRVRRSRRGGGVGRAGRAVG